MVSKAVLVFLSSWIIQNTEFNKIIDDPIFFKVTKKEMSYKACFSSKICRVKAYYIKNEGIFLIDELKPNIDICDQSIVLHEMIHHYQKNYDKKIDLDDRTLWTLQERQAIFYQNLFLLQAKARNNNRGPENILQCEGGTYLDRQYEYNKD